MTLFVESFRWCAWITLFKNRWKREPFLSVNSSLNVSKQVSAYLSFMRNASIPVMFLYPPLIIQCISHVSTEARFVCDSQLNNVPYFIVRMVPISIITHGGLSPCKYLTSIQKSVINNQLLKQSLIDMSV